ncbi:MAG: NYN domain-containing protein [Alphaproteobacteria bacterium]|nr:NYN domain-containing protein [Alphaproteobacteria bacterium]
MENNLAVLIDFENIATGVEKEGLGKLDIGLIMNRLREKGRLLVARSYADWGRYARYKKSLLFEGVSLHELSAHGMNDKNRADVALVVDCMELAFTKDYVDTFVIVSGDSDFTPLITKLRELNKRVLGCGTRRSTSRLIVEACDEFVFYDTLRKQRTTRSRRGRDDSTNELSREEAMELVTEALESIQRDDPAPVFSSILKEHILRKEPAFSENDLGFTSLTRFLEFCQRQGIVRLEKDHKGGGYRVDTPDAAEAQPNDKPLTELGGEARRMYDLLAGEELEPLTRALRAQLCAELVADVAERAESKRRVNLQWVTQDLVKKHKNNPALSSRRIKSLVNALHRGMVFLHSDGDPVRSFFASFEIRKTAPELMGVLDQVYLKRLRELGVKLGKQTADLAELLFDDRGRTRAIEEIIAWELTGPDGGDKGKGPKNGGRRNGKPEKAQPEAPPKDEPAKASAAPEPAPEPAEKAPEKASEKTPEKAAEASSRKRRSRSRKPKEAPAEAAPAETAPAEEPPAEVVAEAPAEEPAPRKRRSRASKPKETPAEEAPAAEAPSEASAEAEPADDESADDSANRKRRKPRRKKVTEAPAKEPPAED